MAPLFSLPICTMVRPLTMIGEHDVKNIGWLLSFVLRQATLPSAALRQESVPLAPSATSFPSATAGDPLGPTNSMLKPEPGLIGADAGYLSFQISFPSAAFKDRITSSAPCRVKT